MQIRICLCSDNHGNEESLNKILNDNPKCDYYFHLGDSHFDEKKLKPFISVKGNNDWEYDFPKKRIVEIMNHRILLFHGDGYTFSEKLLTDKAINEKCDTVFFGHTHMFYDNTYNGIRLINPGSCYHNRDLSNPCYAIVTIESNGIINVERIDIE